MSDGKPTLRGRERGYRLGVVLRAAGFSRRDIVTVLGRDSGWVSRVLSGNRTYRSVDVAAWLQACGVLPGEVRDEVLALSCGADGAVMSFQRWGAGRLDSFRFHASTAVRVREIAPCVLPWVLRTREYTEHLHADRPLEGIYQDAVAEILRGQRPPEWEVVVHEWVLRAPWGTTAQQARQLRRVLDVARLPTVRVRVLPINAGPVLGLGGAFAVLEYESYDPVMYRDDGEVGHFSEDTEDTDRHTVLAHQFSDMALNETESRELINRIHRSLRQPDSASGGVASTRP